MFAEEEDEDENIKGVAEMEKAKREEVIAEVNAKSGSSSSTNAPSGEGVKQNGAAIDGGEGACQEGGNGVQGNGGTVHGPSVGNDDVGIKVNPPRKLCFTYWGYTAVQWAVFTDEDLSTDERSWRDYFRKYPTRDILMSEEFPSYDWMTEEFLDQKYEEHNNDSIAREREDVQQREARVIREAAEAERREEAEKLMNRRFELENCLYANPNNPGILADDVPSRTELMTRFDNRQTDQEYHLRIRNARSGVNYRYEVYGRSVTGLGKYVLIDWITSRSSSLCEINHHGSIIGDDGN